MTAISMVSTPVSAGEPQVVSGFAEVVDGDTLRVAGTELGLFNIDAPEIGQRCENPDGSDYACGRAAAQYLALLIAGAEVTCTLYLKYRAGGPQGICFSSAQNLNREMVARGWALVSRKWKYHEDYLGVEARARELGRGVWRGPFVKPWIWRRRQE